MSEVTLADGVLLGPVLPGRNWSIDSAGSIHDDATASKLGFRGGTVAGDVHMNQFVPVLLEAFGKDWFRTGWLSLNFLNATVDGEPVQARLAQPGADRISAAWMSAEDGREVARGNAGVGGLERSELRTKEFRHAPASDLRILRKLGPGFSLGEHSVFADSRLQSDRVERGLITQPISWYSEPGHWGGRVAGPSSLIDLLWRVPTQYARRYVGDAVGLFGAIEVAQINGPCTLDETYRVTASVAAIGQSPKTEYFWFDSSAWNRAGVEVVSMRMQLRFMKASSPLYAEV